MVILEGRVIVKRLLSIACALFPTELSRSAGWLGVGRYSPLSLSPPFPP